MEQNSRMQALWRRTHPYSAMLLDYQAALASVKARLAELRALAREQNRPGSQFRLPNSTAWKSASSHSLTSSMSCAVI